MQIDLDKFQNLLKSFAAAPQMPSVENRYEQLADIDPYPGIPSALLHAGHIASYAIATGMVDPLELEELSKPASYLVRLEGPVRYMDENDVEQSFYLSDRNVQGERDVRRRFELKPNSLCYVTLRPKFRMPSYIAGRFNLLIRDVYRGLLVGTGPLVDPGFVGYLSIPLHNFTSNSYLITAGEGFVYFEFTKISWQNESGAVIPDWVPPAINCQPPFPRSKNNRKDLDDYISQATGGKPAQNALISQIERLKTASDRVDNRLRVISLAAWAVAAGLIIATISGLGTAVQIYVGAQQYTQSSRVEFQAGIEKIADRLSKSETELELLKKQLSDINQGRTPSSK